MENTITKKSKYQCSKCSNTTYEAGEIYAAGGFWSKIFDIQGTHFTTVTCTKCKYTDFYKGKMGSKGANVLDFFTT